MQAHLDAAGEAAAVHAAVHVVAVQRIKAHAAAGRRQLAHLPHQAVHRLLHSAHRACCIVNLQRTTCLLQINLTHERIRTWGTPEPAQELCRAAQHLEAIAWEVVILHIR